MLWNRELRLQERGSDMRRHVIQAFASMDVTLAVLRRDRLEKPFQIRQDIRAGILLNEKRGGGMAAENREQAGRDVLPGRPSGQLRGDLDKTFAEGLNVLGMERLTHWNKGGFEKFIPRLYMKREKSKSMKAPGYARRRVNAPGLRCCPCVDS